MRKLNNILKIACCTFIISLGVVSLTSDNAKAQYDPTNNCNITQEELAENFGDGTAYFGNWDVHYGGCWLSYPINCLHCGG